MPSWYPVTQVPCPACGEGVAFDATDHATGVLYRARTRCPVPGGVRSYAVPLLVASGRVAVADDLTALSEVECPGIAHDAALRAYDLALAAAGIVMVRTSLPRATLYGRGGMLLVAHAPGTGGNAQPDGLQPGDVPLGTRAGPRAQVCLMDHDLFLDRCRMLGFPPESFRPDVVEVDPGPWRVLLRAGRPAEPGSLHALVAPSDRPSKPPVDIAFGEDVGSGQALALLRTLSRRTGSPFATVAQVLCFPDGDFVWSRGSLRQAPRPRDATASAGTAPPAGAATLRVPPWPALSPPLPGTRAHATARLSARLSWTIPPLQGDSLAPIQRLPAEIHPHWLALALLFATIASGRPDLFYELGGKPDRQVRIMRRIRSRLAARAAAAPDRAAVDRAMAQWVALDPSDWPT